MRKWIVPVVSALAVAVVFVGYTRAGDKDKGKYKDKGNSAAVAIGQPAPEFSLPDQNGKTVNLSDFAGKIVVLEWFNEECPVVVAHYKADTMNSRASKYASQDVVWLAINSTRGKTNESNKAIATEWKIDRPLLNDASGQVGKMYGAKVTPHMYIINKDGALAYMGAIDNQKKENGVNYVDKALGEILAGNSVSEPQTKAYGCSVKYAN